MIFCAYPNSAQLAILIEFSISVLKLAEYFVEQEKFYVNQDLQLLLMQIQIRIFI